MHDADSTIRFEAKPDGDGFLAVPPNPALTEGSTIEGVMNLFPFRAVLARRNGHFAIPINPLLQRAANLIIGESASIELTRINDEPEVRLPADFRKSLQAEPAALKQWGTITPNARRDWVLWFITCKQEETRKLHAAKACDMLSHGKKRICCFGGLGWLTKNAPDVDTWVPLPK